MQQQQIVEKINTVMSKINDMALSFVKRLEDKNLTEKIKGIMYNQNINLNGNSEDFFIFENSENNSFVGIQFVQNITKPSFTALYSCWNGNKKEAIFTDNETEAFNFLLRE